MITTAKLKWIKIKFHVYKVASISNNPVELYTSLYLMTLRCQIWKARVSNTVSICFNQMLVSLTVCRTVLCVPNLGAFSWLNASSSTRLLQCNVDHFRICGVQTLSYQSAVAFGLQNQEISFSGKCRCQSFSTFFFFKLLSISIKTRSLGVLLISFVYQRVV